MQLNCRGYHNNRHLLANTIVSENPDVVLLNDIGVLPPTRTVKHYGYTTRHTQGPHDGVAIMVKGNIRHEFMEHWINPHFLATKIYTHNNNSLIIATTYTRPDTYIPFADLNNLFNHNIPTYIIADMNALHPALGHTRHNRHGNQLHLLMTQKRLRFLGPYFNTTYTHRGSGRPDVAITNRFAGQFQHHIHPGKLCGSDHIPILLHVSTNPIAIPSTTHYNYKHADWEAFQETLQQTHITPNVHNQHHLTLDAHIENLHTQILQAADTHIPKRSYKIYYDFTPSPRSRRLITCYHNTFERNKHSHLRVGRTLEFLREHILHSLAIDHDEHWLHLVKQTQGNRTTNPTQFWNRINRLRGTDKQSFEYLNVNNVRIIDPAQVTAAFKDHWSQIFTPHAPAPFPAAADHIANITAHMNQQDISPEHLIRLHTLQQNNSLTTPIEENEVKRLLQRAPRRASGTSGISWAMARHLPHNIISTLTTIYNASLATGYFPRPYKKATTILLPKPNKNYHLPENYRPISLLEVLGKVFEKLVNHRLRIHLEQHNLLSDKQFGFRQLHSTEDALNTILAYLKVSYPTEKCAIVTKDVKQAFDTVWHLGLKYKICNNFQLPLITQKLLCSFLSDRKMRIRHKTSYSEYFTPSAGVPQGSSLSPTLYNMYTHDLPNPRHPGSLTIQYADDVTHLARSRTIDTLTNRLQAELSATSQWELKWLIHSHPQKTQVTYLTKKREAPRQIYLYPFLPNQAPIQITHTNKILGLTIDKNINLHQHVIQKAAMASKTLNSLYRFRDSDIKTKLHLYKALVQPHLTYCPLALSLTANSNLLKLQAVQNKALRLALDAKWYDFRTAESLHEDALIPPLNIILHHRILNQLEKYKLWHENTYTFIESLPRLRTYKNILDIDNHPPPNPIFTYRNR